MQGLSSPNVGLLPCQHRIYATDFLSGGLCGQMILRAMLAEV